MTALQVHLGDRSVGWLELEDGGSTFTFDGDYLDAADRPVLGQWFEDRLTRQSRSFRAALPPWFQNLLPESGGRVRRRLARELGCAEEDDEALLIALGGDLPGSVRVSRSGAAPLPAPATVSEPQAEVSPALRASLGGMQLKFTLSGTPDRLTLPVRDDAGVRWILKVSEESLFPGLAENEAAISGWLRAAGFEVPEVHVIPREAFPDLGELSSDTRWGFLIRRYDRREGARIHQEDFLQVLNRPRTAKYDATHAVGLGRLVRQILGERGVDEYLRRTVAVVAAGNADAHLKNWSLLYPDGMQATFTPLYDQVSTIAFPAIGRRMALRIGNAHEFGEVTAESLQFLGRSLGITDTTPIVEEVLSRLSAAFTGHAFAPSLGRLLTEHWERVPLLRGRLATHQLRML